MNLYYIHDPMCSWCYAFSPILKKITMALQDRIQIQPLLGGLAADSEQPMTNETRQFVRQAWQRIISEVPGTTFNFDFWDQCQPRRSTYPACRAVLVARQSSSAHEQAMISAIQQAYYQQARNPSDDDVLCSLAGDTGLDTDNFARQLNAPDTQRALRQEIDFVRSLGATSFPSLILQTTQSVKLIAHSYTEPDAMLLQIEKALL